MYKTYELYPEGTPEGGPEGGGPEGGPEGGGGFEPVTCRSHEELMAAVERLMAERRARAVEVRHFGTHLFTVTD